MSDMPDYCHAIYTSVKNTWQDAENLDDTHGYITYIWIPEETYKVDLMKLHIYSEQFRAYSKSALDGGAAVVTSGGGGAVVKTSSGGGVHSHTISGATSSYTSPSHTHQVVIGTKTSAGGGDHRHIMFNHYTDGQGPGEERQYYCIRAGTGYSVIVTMFTDGAYNLETWEASGTHTHNVVIGTITSASGGGNHAHTISGQTSNQVANHTHTVTLTDHTHTVTILDHTHDIDFGIYEESITGRTLSAILYAPDGTELEDFGVVLTGEDSDIIDLTDHFETLEYGMYKMILSASGRLRARLVFYELCKMYAQY